jgi:MarR family transcriptional regulator, lower aerobic nicotinate degradation pathway regulator
MSKAKALVAKSPETVAATSAAYVLDEQVGFILRQVSQRHAVIFAAQIGSDLTPMQWAALAKLHEVGPTSQNQLGRMTAMDVATIKGVVDRLIKRGLIGTRPDPADARRRLVALTRSGRALAEAQFADALAISEMTLAPLSDAERKTFQKLLSKLK